MVASPYDAETRQFSISADGTVRGDDGESGRLAASLGYAARLAAQVEYLLDIGTLQELTTVSAEGITAKVVRDDAGGLGLSVAIETQQYRDPKVFTIVGGSDLDAALLHCAQRVQQVPGVRWSAITTDDRRLVAASPPPPGPTPLGPAPAVANVGVRGLAVLEAIDERLRESWVRLRYTHGALLVAGVGEHCLYAVVDTVESVAFGDALDETRAVLGPFDLRSAATLPPASAAAGGTSQEREGRASPVPLPTTAAAAPVGMRYRAPQPRAKDSRRGLFGR